MTSCTITDLSLLKKLTETSGISGQEDSVRKIVSEELASLCKNVEIDRLGNLIGRIPGSGPKVVITAHMDEVGMMVSKVDEKGFLRVIPIGDLDFRNCFSQMVIVHGKKELCGVIGLSPSKFSESDVKRESDGWESIFIDLGMEAADVKADVKIGDAVTFKSFWYENHKTVFSKAFDDRVGLYVMIEAVKQSQDIDCDLYLVATVQEEIGLKGIGPAVFDISPDILIALEGTHCPDTPNDKVSANITPICMGHGPELRIRDRQMLSDRVVVDWLSELAEKAEIPCQRAVKNFGNTDASHAQITGRGIRVSVLSTPIRYLHSPVGLIDKGDLENAVKLTCLILEKASLLSVKF